MKAVELEFIDVESLVVGLKDEPFLAVDIAQQGPRWKVVEINPGGAAGVPDGGNVNDYYRALRAAFPG